MSKLQEEFVQDLSKLMQEIPKMGFTVTLGEGYRTAEQAEWDCQHHTGIANSLHRERLAQDLNFYKDGVWVKDGSELAAVGKWWKALGPMHRWGGDFKDGNHFSISPDGVRS